MRTTIVYLLAASLCFSVDAFLNVGLGQSAGLTTRDITEQSTTARFLADGKADDSEIVAKRIIVKGDVGGYYRSCVANEVSKASKVTVQYKR